VEVLNATLAQFTFEYLALGDNPSLATGTAGGNTTTAAAHLTLAPPPNTAAGDSDGDNDSVGSSGDANGTLPEVAAGSEDRAWVPCHPDDLLVDVAGCQQASVPSAGEPSTRACWDVWKP